MKLKQIIAAILIVFVGFFTSACSAEDIFNNNYGTQNVGIKNIQEYIGELSLVEGTGFFDESKELESFQQKIKLVDTESSETPSMCGFVFKVLLTLDDNIVSVTETVEIVYVVDITVTYLDTSKEKQRLVKTWENLEFKFVFEEGDREAIEAETFIKSATVENLNFGECIVTKKVYFSDVSSCIKVVLESRYIKSAKGKIEVNKPE